jgi:hypothetical protein
MRPVDRQKVGVELRVGPSAGEQCHLVSASAQSGRQQPGMSFEPARERFSDRMSS